MNETTTHELDALINRSNYQRNWRHIPEAEQQEIAEFCRTHAVSGASSKYRMGAERVKLICQKFGVTPPFYAYGPKDRTESTAWREQLQQMVGHVYEYMAKDRLIYDFEEQGEHVLLKTFVQCSQPYERTVKLKRKGIAKALSSDFRKVQ